MDNTFTPHAHTPERYRWAVMVIRNVTTSRETKEVCDRVGTDYDELMEAQEEIEYYYSPGRLP